MRTNNQLFAAIEKGLNTGEMFASGINDYVSPGITDARSALTELRAQVADLLAFYRYNTTWTMSNYEAYCALCDRLASIQESPVDDPPQA